MTKTATATVPFEKTLPAKLLLVAVALVTIGGALVSLLGLDPHIGPPLVLVAGGLTALVGIVLGIYDHPVHVLMAALLGPFALWPMTMVVIYAATHPTIGWGLLALGGLPVAFALAAIRRPAPKSSTRAIADQRTIAT